MAARANKPVSVTLGSLAERVEARVKSGDYASVSEVVRAGIRALEREEAILDRLLPPLPGHDRAWDAFVKAKVRQSLDDPRPPIPAKEAFARLDDRISEYKAKNGL